MIKLLVLASLLSTPTWAATKASVAAPAEATRVDELLNLKERPTMEQTLKFLPSIKEDADKGVAGAVLKNNFAIDVGTWTQKLIQHGPELIAAMEKTYPGATWVFVGRDSQNIGDLVEAFYLSIGQHDRVRRLMVSKESFTKASEGTLLGLLETHGLDLQNLRASDPFILVDTVSGGGGRQGRQLLKAAYNEYKANGGNPSELVRKFNIFGLLVSTFRGAANLYTGADVLLDKQEINYNDNKPHDFAAEERFPGYKEDKDNSNEAGYEHFTGAWTGSYGLIVKDPSGFVHATPGEVKAPEFRSAILWIQKKIWMAVNTESFKDQVVAAASNLDFSFPLRRPAPRPLPSSSQITARQEKIINRELEHNNLLLEEAAKQKHANLDAYYEWMQKSATVNNSVPDGLVQLTTVGRQVLDGWGSIIADYGHDATLAAPNYLKMIRAADRKHKLNYYDRLFILQTALGSNPQLSFELIDQIRKIPKWETIFADPQFNKNDNIKMFKKDFEIALPHRESCSIKLGEAK